MEAFKMAGALVVVLMIMGVTLWVAKQILGQQRGNGGTPELQLLGGLRLGPGKSVVLVDIAGEVLVLGSTSKELTLLTRVNDPDRVNRLRPQAAASFPRLNALSGNWWGMATSKRSGVMPGV
ncbi:MAG: flagellar biosynthetic protein FliO [Nitrospirota bacterium]|nr:flagellar biosynthetic protein FliO [Nitrospirota bacterium]